MVSEISESPAEAVALDPQALDGLEQELADVARALERLDEGTYGTCEVCAVGLPEDLLAAAPAALRCAAHPAGAR